MMPTVTRFAPSPTGLLHLGHAYSALYTHDAARRADGRFLLRMEDIDVSRCRPEFEAAIIDDLGWLGLTWNAPLLRQSERMDAYAAALRTLDGMDLLYPCFCTRKEIQAEIARAGAAPHGPDGPIYPGTCRGLDPAVRARRMARGDSYALRLDIERAVAATGPLTVSDRIHGVQPVDGKLFGDVVLARKDTPTSYHLAVVVDDAAQGVTLVTRGVDLLPAAQLHRVLQTLLGYPAPDYEHHRLLTDAGGRRYAKRDRSLTLQALRRAGYDPSDVRRMIDEAA